MGRFLSKSLVLCVVRLFGLGLARLGVGARVDGDGREGRARGEGDLDHVSLGVVGLDGHVLPEAEDDVGEVGELGDLGEPGAAEVVDGRDAWWGDA